MAVQTDRERAPERHSSRRDAGERRGDAPNRGGV